MELPLHRVSTRGLDGIAKDLRSGRLAPPYTPLGLHGHALGETARELAGGMQRLADEGVRPEALARIIDAIVADRGERAGSAEAIDLVWSGPECEGVASRDTGVVVREMFREARDSVILAGYAVHQGRRVFRDLAARMDRDRDLKARLYLDVRRPRTDTSLDSEILARFSLRFRTEEWPGERLPEVYYDPRSLSLDPQKRSALHAKVVVADRRIALVSSANFTEAAQERNIEVGVLIREQAFAARLAGHFDSLASAGALRVVPGLGGGGRNSPLTAPDPRE